MQDEETKENIKLLRKLAKERDNLVAFVGAGASKPLKIDTWHELLKKMSKRFETQVDVDGLKENGKTYPEIASEIYNSIRGQDKHDKYLDFLHDQFIPRAAYWTSLHYIVIDRFKAIITTNYDTSFEKALEDRNVDFGTQKLPDFNPFDLFRKRTIVYLHGNNDQRKYILRKEEYDLYYPSISNIQNGSPEVEEFLKGVIKNTILVFLAFSFDDMYFYELFKKIVKEDLMKEEYTHAHAFHMIHPRKAAGQQLHHFAIMPYNEKGSEEARANQLRGIQSIRELGVKVILFDNSDERYTQLEDIIGKLPTLVTESFEGSGNGT